MLTNLSFIQNGEPIDDNLLNRCSRELINNDIFLNNYKVDNSEDFLAAEIIPAFKVCKLTNLGMILASCSSNLRSSGFLGVSMVDIEPNSTGRFLIMGKIPIIEELGIPIYLGIDGSITTVSPTIIRILGYSLGNSFFFNPKD